MKSTQVSTLISDYASTLLASPLFHGFTEENLRNFFSHAELLVRDYKKNDFVALSGTPMEGLGIILEGSLLITRENVMGQRVIMTEFYPSQMFGEALIFSHQPLWLATIKTTARSYLFRSTPSQRRCQNARSAKPPFWLISYAIYLIKPSF